MPRSSSDGYLSRIESRFRESLLALVRPRRGLGLLVAFSGGADSTALLSLCLAVKDEFGLKVSAAHLDHGLRGREAERDRRAAERAARRAGAAFYWDRVDCQALARSESLSLEQAARQARYAFLKQVRQEAGAEYIVTGHTADDNAESVLLNLLRGSGPKGLAGIPPVREGFIVRPLLGFWRRELLEYLAVQGLTWVEDSSNLDLSLTRNKVRRDLLPRLIQDYNPGVKAALVRTAALLRDEERVWNELLTEAKDRVAWEVKDGCVRLNIFGLNSLDRAVGRRLVRAGVQAVRGQAGGLTMDHVETVLNSVASGGRLGLDLPGRIRAWTEEDQLVLGRKAKETPLFFSYELGVPASVYLAEIGLTLKAEVHSRPQDLDLKGLGPGRAAADLDSLTLPLTIRNQRPGDRFRPLGMTGTKKLHDFFIDTKVPARERPRIPLVLDRRGIIWVGGLRLAHGARVRPRSGRALLLTLE